MSQEKCLAMLVDAVLVFFLASLIYLYEVGDPIPRASYNRYCKADTIETYVCI